MTQATRAALPGHLDTMLERRKRGRGNKDAVSAAAGFLLQRGHRIAFLRIDRKIGAEALVCDLRFADELGLCFARYRGCGENEIGLLDVLCQHIRDLLLLFHGQLARIAALSGRIHPGFNEFRAQRWRLLLSFRTHVLALDQCAETVGRGERFEACDSEAHHKDFRRTDRACGCRNPGQDARKMGRAEETE